MVKSNTGIWLTLGIIFGVLLLVSGWWAVTYNSLVSLDEQTQNAFGNIQSAYQRRADLVPNLVATVKAYSEYEGDLLTTVTQARASVGSARTPSELVSAGDSLNDGISRLLVVVENYPDLKASQQYLDLQTQLEGTENRIKVERDNYNAAIRAYNTKIRSFPTSIVAQASGYQVKSYFEAASGSDTAPNVGDML